MALTKAQKAANVKRLKAKKALSGTPTVGTSSALKKFREGKTNQKQLDTQIAINKKTVSNKLDKPKVGSKALSPKELGTTSTVKTVDLTKPEETLTNLEAPKLGDGGTMPAETTTPEFTDTVTSGGLVQRKFADGTIVNNPDKKLEAQTKEEIREEFGFEAVPEQTKKQQAAEFLDRQLQEKTQLEKRLAESKKIAAEQEASSRGAAIANTAESRLGASTSSAGLVRKRFLTAASRVSENARNRITAAEKEFKEAQKAQREAVVSGEREAQLKAAERLAKAEAEVTNAQTNADEKAFEQSQAEIDVQQQKNDNFFDTVEALGSSFADLGIDSLSNLLEGTDIDFGTALGLQKEAQLQKEIAETKNEQEAEKLALELERLQKSNEQIGKKKDTEAEAAIKGFATLNSALQSGAISQEAFDSLSQEMGFAQAPEKAIKDPNFQSVKVGDDVYSFNPKTGEFDRKIGESSNGNLVPTGESASSTFNGKNVTLDSSALSAFAQVNAELVKAGMGEINIGSVADSSTRKQADTISRMAERFGIGFNAENPNETAGILRGMGHAVANVGNSMHEKGLAVDLFPDHAYIAKVKPFMEANGWKQTIPNGDAGHFEFQGKMADKEFTETDKAILSAIDPTKITSTTLTLLGDAGLTTKDLGKFLATEKKQLSPEKKTEIEDILTAISDLEKLPGFEAAVGAGIQKTFTPFLGEEDFIAGTEAQDFAREFVSFRDKMVLPNLDKLKGAMSDKDIQFIRNAGTSLSLSTSEKQFKKTLGDLKKKYTEILEEGGEASLGLETIESPEKLANVSDIIGNLFGEINPQTGLQYTVPEIDAVIINMGFDPQQFKK